MERILIIEDEEKIARFVELELTHEGYQVDKAMDGRDGLEKIKTRPFDLILLDVMLPGINGVEVLRRIRQTSEVPVILLTARDSVVDKVTGLDAGADDYVTKPFAIEELLARVRMTLRKTKGVRNTMLTAGQCQLDIILRTCSVNGVDIELTKKEFDLLQALMENKNRILSREVLLEKIWGYEFDGTTNAIDVYIRHLRQKIEEPFNLRLITAIRGIGYVIKDE
ncbi:MAG: DNA-binding response regulator [Firmicutes bacterium HGW-Firmicutes-20]|jgi:DNA-binding response OmpR family regulator|nr:MAG: DNA-binding response regulator [Firmicutes bacterium HGW-Firmicutes-20]PKM89846.1 MAG: DNA-binding response regulator [Firmicutes bacterium HGW-Firmicutes-10]